MLPILSRIQKNFPNLFRFQLLLLLKIRQIFKATDVILRSASNLFPSAIYPVNSVRTAARNSNNNDSSKTAASIVLVFALIWLSGYQDSAYAADSQVGASPCTQEDEKTAESWKYYEPEEAYEFGKQIQDLVRNQDLEGIFQLVEGELEAGPRKSFVKGKTFNEVFPEEWVKEFLAEEPPCSPLGWRGFRMPFQDPNVVYQKGEKWQIERIYGANVEAGRPGTELVGWRVNGRLLHPACFSIAGWSGNQFSSLSEHYGCDVFESPGLCLGKEIADFSPIISSDWCAINGSLHCEKLSLAHMIENCSPTDFDHYTAGTLVGVARGEYGFIDYNILATVSADDCAKLAPNLDMECESSYLLQIFDNGGGSMTLERYGIFGVFVHGPIGFVAPLKYLPGYNESLNFLDELASEANSQEQKSNGWLDFF